MLPPARRLSFLRVLAPVFLVAAAVLVAGCSGGPSDAVSGEVKMKDGKAVNGEVVFTGGGKEYKGPLTTGKYKVENLPKGEYDVMIKGFGGPAVQVPKDSKVPESNMGVSPPDKYSKPGVLPKYNYPGGRQTQNFTLDP